MDAGTQPGRAKMGQRDRHPTAYVAQCEPFGRGKAAGASSLVDDRCGGHRRIVAVSAQVRADDVDRWSGALHR